ncbi:hypothetical protein ACWDOP_03430 [Nocardia sp. NPDC003693]
MISRGEVRSYLPNVAGRNQPSSMAGSKVLIISSTDANEWLPTVLTLPIYTDTADIPPQMMSLAVPFGDLDPLPRAAVLVYRPLTIFRGWLTEPEGVVSRATMRQVFAAMVRYIDE